MFCNEKVAGTVASLAWPFLLRETRSRALSDRRRMPEIRNTSLGTTDVDKLYYVKLRIPNHYTTAYSSIFVHYPVTKHRDSDKAKSVMKDSE
jgi:hypothetical protein